MPGHGLKLGLLAGVEWVPLVPRVFAIARHESEIAVIIQHNPLLAGSIGVQVRHMLP